jgi:hypothetical protein
VLKHFTNLFIYNRAAELLKHALEELPEGSVVTFVVDTCYAGGLIEMKLDKIVLLTSCRTHEKSSGFNIGSVFANPFLELIEESFRSVNNSYPPITNRQLIRSIMLISGKRVFTNTRCIFYPSKDRFSDISMIRVE